MQLNANRAANHREPTDSTSLILFFFFLQARLGTTPFSTPSGHVYRCTLSDRGRYAFRQNWLYADPWRCAALSYKLHFHLLLTEKTNNVTPMLHCKVNTKLQRYKLRNELHRGVQTHVNQPSKSASCETSKQTHAEPLLQYITEATEAPIFRKWKSSGAHAIPLCGRFSFDTPRGGSGCCEAPCKEDVPWPSGTYLP